MLAIHWLNIVACLGVLGVSYMLAHGRLLLTDLLIRVVR